MGGLNVVVAKENALSAITIESIKNPAGDQPKKEFNFWEFIQFKSDNTLLIDRKREVSDLFNKQIFQ